VIDAVELDLVRDVKTVQERITELDALIHATDEQDRVTAEDQLARRMELTKRLERLRTRQTAAMLARVRIGREAPQPGVRRRMGGRGRRPAAVAAAPLPRSRQRKRMTASDSMQINAVLQATSDIHLAVEHGMRLGYKKSAVYATIANPLLEARPKRSSTTKWAAAEIAEAVSWIEQNKTATLKETIAAMHARDPVRFPVIAVSTLQDYFDLSMVSYKMTTDQNQRRNDIDTKTKRCDYAIAKLNSPLSVDAFVDEMGCNAGTTRRFGRSPLGERVIQITPANPGVNQSVCAAITAGHGVVYYETRTGAYTTVDFTAFISRLLVHLEQTLPSMDNVSFSTIVAATTRKRLGKLLRSTA
jgi:hypothetical protein